MKEKQGEHTMFLDEATQGTDDMGAATTAPEEKTEGTDGGEAGQM
jgi:hypothetical protein